MKGGLPRYHALKGYIGTAATSTASPTPTITVAAQGADPCSYTSGLETEVTHTPV